MYEFNSNIQLVTSIIIKSGTFISFEFFYQLLLLVIGVPCVRWPATAAA